MTVATDWDPALYLQFQAQREVPWRDLLSLVRGPREPNT